MFCKPFILRRDDVMKAFGLSSSSSTLPAAALGTPAHSVPSDSQSSGFDWFMDYNIDEDSQVSAAQPTTVQTNETGSAFVEHMDESIGRPVRLLADGSQVTCLDMVPGDDGFMWASWPDGSKTKTEMTVLFYKSPHAVMKRPSSCMMGPKKQAQAVLIVGEEDCEADDEDYEDDDDDGLRLPVMKKPAKKLKPVLKKCSEVVFDFPENRFELFPEGCAKCKFKKPGCTRSCWIYRLKLNR
jgi:hypothetical protein